MKSGLSAESVAAKLTQTEDYNGQLVNLNIGRDFEGKDQSCYDSQANQLGLPANKSLRGSYGYTYALASILTGGIIGDICATDYGQQLTSIACVS